MSTVTLPVIIVPIALGTFAIIVFLVYTYLKKVHSRRIRLDELTINNLTSDLERIRENKKQEFSQENDVRNTNIWLAERNTQLKEDLALSQKKESDARDSVTKLSILNTQLRLELSTGIRDTNTKLSNQNAQLKQELASTQKQLATSVNSLKFATANKEIKSNTNHPSPALVSFATQVLKFLAEAVSSLDTIPNHTDEHYRKDYLLELERGSRLITDSIADTYHEATQRLFTYWAPIIQKHILFENANKMALSTAKQQLTTLQAQLSTATRDAAKDTDRVKTKLSQELEIVRKEAEQAKAALSKHIANASDIKKAYDKLNSDIKSLSTSYLSRRQITFCEVSAANDFKYFCLLPYLPLRAQATTEQQLNRERVWRFKDGQNTKEIAYLISIALLRCFTPLQLQTMVLAVIPASTAAKNTLRYEKFCVYVAEYTGLVNGYQCISVTQDREALKGSTSANKVANLIYNNATIKGRQILLFDDVMTSGGSFKQNANCLVENGAASVTGIFLARTQRV